MVTSVIYNRELNSGRSRGRARGALGSFLKSPDNQRARKAVLVYLQDRGFSSFASNMMKLSVNETKWSSLLARNCVLILYNYFDLNI